MLLEEGLPLGLGVFSPMMDLFRSLRGLFRFPSRERLLLAWSGGPALVEVQLLGALAEDGGPGDLGDPQLLHGLAPRSRHPDPLSRWRGRRHLAWPRQHFLFCCSLEADGTTHTHIRVLSVQWHCL